MLLWAFGPDDSEPTIAIIGVHCGYDPQRDENVGLVFMNHENLIDLYGKEKWSKFFEEPEE